MTSTEVPEVISKAQHHVRHITSYLQLGTMARIPVHAPAQMPSTMSRLHGKGSYKQSKDEKVEKRSKALAADVVKSLKKSHAAQFEAKTVADNILIDTINNMVSKYHNLYKGADLKAVKEKVKKAMQNAKNSKKGIITGDDPKAAIELLGQQIMKV